jgi:hypothetical protein
MDRSLFKKEVKKLELLHKTKKPGISLILKSKKKCCILTDYLSGTNKMNSFIINNGQSKKLKSVLKKCKKPEIVLFLHIYNAIKKKSHLNLLIINTVKGVVTRIDPSDTKLTQITSAKFRKAFKPFFKKFGLKFVGFDKRSKVFKHGGLCRYATPAEYIYGRSINFPKLKKIIKSYFNLKC